jgi:hypothetical protein
MMVMMMVAVVVVMPMVLLEGRRCGRRLGGDRRYPCDGERKGQRGDAWEG